MSHPDEDDDDEYQEQADDEEDDDEEEFVPGVEDDDESIKEADPENTIDCFLNLKNDEDGPHLQINGNGVRLSGPWVEDGSCTLAGTLEPVAISSPLKAPPRTFACEVTTNRTKDSTLYHLKAHDTSMQFNLQFGSLEDTAPGTIEWKRISPPVATPAPAAAAAMPHKNEDDDDEVADEALDYSELVALHEDAGRPVQAVLLQSQEDEPPSKRARHDDDDVEF